MCTCLCSVLIISKSLVDVTFLKTGLLWLVNFKHAGIIHLCLDVSPVHLLLEGSPKITAAFHYPTHFNSGTALCGCHSVGGWE